MIATINRTGITIELPSGQEERCADAVWERYGYERVDPLDIENSKEIQWDGIEFNRLLTKGGILYRFNYWLAAYPYKTIEIEEIGRIA